VEDIITGTPHNAPLSVDEEEYIIFIPYRLSLRFQQSLSGEPVFIEGHTLAMLSTPGERLFRDLPRFDTLFTALNMWTSSPGTKSNLQRLLDKVNTMYPYFNVKDYVMQKSYTRIDPRQFLITIDAQSVRHQYKYLTSVYHVHDRILEVQRGRSSVFTLFPRISYLSLLDIDFPLFFLVSIYYSTHRRIQYVFCTMNHTVQTIFRSSFDPQELCFIFQAGQIRWRVSSNDYLVWIYGTAERIADGMNVTVEPIFPLHSTKLTTLNI